MTVQSDAHAIERRFPLVPLERRTAAQLLAPVTAAPIDDLELLSGGHVNTNYVATAGGVRFVIRIYARGEAVFRKETELLRTLRALLAVPELLHASATTELLPYPYAVLAWIEGVPLNGVIASSVDAARQAGEQIAIALARLRTLPPIGIAAADLARSVADALSSGGATRWLRAGTAERLLALVEDNAGVVASAGRSVVHGDFQNDNLLLSFDGRWRLAGILDWEWAHDGSWLEDVGSLLRFDGAHAGAFRDTLGGALDGALPHEWRRAASIADLAALCEKLTHPTHRGEVTARAVRLIERCIAEYGGAG